MLGGFEYFCRGTVEDFKIILYIRGRLMIKQLLNKKLISKFENIIERTRKFEI